MFDTIALIMFGIAGACFILLAYTILCCVDMHKKFKNENSSSITKKYTWNLFLDLIIIVYKKFVKGATAGLAGANDKIAMASLKAVYKKVKKAAYGNAIVSLLIAVISIIIGIQLLQVNEAIKTVATSIQSIFGDDDCTCYAMCTNNPEDDLKCTYELIFGPDEYQRLLNDMVLTPEEQEKFETLYDACIEFNKNYSKESGEHIIPYINETMVSDYRQAIGNNSKFMSHDGKDRTKMTNDELKADLIKLLSDYKQNGRNPNCKCYEYSGTKLERKCNGEKHWTKGWEWEEIPDGTTPTPGPTPTPPGPTPGDGGELGHATGQYAITLDDGLSYYWYHQSSGCNCVNTVIDPTYGKYANLRLGGEKKSGHIANAATRGCSTYATAMALSNILGKEITPYIVLTDVLGESIKSGCEGYWCAHDGSNGIRITSEPMAMYKAKITAKAMEVYASDGLQAKAINMNQSEVDEILAKNGVVVCSISGASWEWYNNASSSHFILIRKKDTSTGLYYCLNSTYPKDYTDYGPTSDARCKKTMDIGVPWSTLSSHFHNADGAAYWKEGGSGGGGGEYTPTGDWYSDANRISKYNNRVNIYKEVYAYNGLPWNANVDTYVIDTDASTKSLFSWTKQTSSTGESLNIDYANTIKKSGRFCKGVGFWLTPNEKGKTVFDYMRWGGWEAKDAGCLKTIDGIDCVGVAPPPTVVDKAYCDDYNQSAWKTASSASSSLYQNRKMAIILESKSGNGVWYLPCTPADAKGHTFPGGIAQTNIKANGVSGNAYNVRVAGSSGDSDGYADTWEAGMVCNKLNTVTTAGNKPTAYMYNVCETYGWKSDLLSAVQNNYRVIGYVVW